jgi:hypothetical protein
MRKEKRLAIGEWRTAPFQPCPMMQIRPDVKAGTRIFPAADEDLRGFNQSAP